MFNTFILHSPLLTIIATLTLTLFYVLIINTNRVFLIRQLCLLSSFAALCIAMLMCLSFDKSAAGYQFMSSFSFIPEYNTSFALGVDGLSFIFLVLTLITFPILFLSAWGVTKAPKQFFCHLLGMEILLVLTFTTIDLFYFFVLFESLLIPMFILIGVWGARTRKVKAAYYFFLYTLFGSLFMLFGMIYLYQITGSLNYFVLMSCSLAAADQELIWACFFLAFAVKMPLFPFHIWLPEAHVEAPTSGSMLLASLLLKLGGYGFLRFSLTFLREASDTFTPYVSACALVGVVYGSLSTLRQIDLKRIIAYSSVAHMNLVVLGIFSRSFVGLEGALFLMVAHGVVSTALFLSVGVLYDRTHTRLLRYCGGLATVMPLFASGLFLFSLANMSFPGTPNFIGELLIFMGILEGLSLFTLFLSSPGIILAAAYSVFLFNRTAFGTLKTKYALEFTDMTRREVYLFAALFIAAQVLGLCGNIILEFSRYSIADISLPQDAQNYVILVTTVKTRYVHARRNLQSQLGGRPHLTYKGNFNLASIACYSIYLNCYYTVA